MDTRNTAAARGERGFALILAILSLMLLTFLGLTLATTTSTELQIATNYRWSQQALYNAEAGMEAARIVLSNNADPGVMWLNTLPQPRIDGGGAPLWWPEGSAPGPVETGYTGRDFYNMSCDDRGGVGYGLVLSDLTTRYEDVSSFQNETLNGAFTIWIRRPLQVNDQGEFSDLVGDNDSLVIVSEGRAPFSGSAAGGGTEATFIRSRQAVRVLETRFALEVLSAGDPCLGGQAGQEGMSPTGENFNPCAAITAGAGGSLEGAFGAAGSSGTGALTGTGVE